MKKLIITAAMVIMAAYSSFGAINDNAGIIFPVLNMGVGARAMAMGGAFTAVADDASAIYWNAAGLSKVRAAQVGLVYDKMFMDTMFGHLLFAYPMAAGTLGANVTYLSMGSVMGSDDYGIDTGEISPYSIAASVGYGANVTKEFSLGGVVKIINQSIGSTSDTAYAADVGAAYSAGIVSVGLSAQNIGFGTDYSMPTNIAAGAGVKAVNTKEHAVLAELDLQYMLNDAAAICAGVEYTYNSMLSARIGYKLGLGETDLEGLKGLSAGVGVEFQNINFDYAMVTYGDLGVTHKATIMYSFGTPVKKAGITPKSAATAAKQGAGVKTKSAKARAKAALAEGIALEKAGYADKAMAKYTQALKDDNQIAEGWKRLGGLYYKKGKKKETIACYTAYLKLYPNDKKTAEWLAKYKAAK